jgi:hypothetical protein
MIIAKLVLCTVLLAALVLWLWREVTTRRNR